jgi:adenylate cyclase
MTATGEIDTWAIPNAAGRVPGVFIHAAAMDTILRQQFLVDTGRGTTWAINLLLIFICALSLPLCGTWRWTDILKGTGIIVLLLLAFLITGSLLASNGRLINVFYPSFSLILLYMINIIYIAVREQTDKRFVKGLFGRYVSPQVASQIVVMANNGALALGGEEREVSVFFADIRNYTTISEKMTPEAIVKMLNKHLPVIIEAVVKNGGIVNKFAGDSIMAVWNAPQSQSDHAALAVKAAWEAQLELAKISQEDNLPIPVKFGIGVNTGKALAGNVGSTGRSEYTVIGDTINLASRICSATPGCEVWIGPDTYRKVVERCTLVALEPQSFKGKTSPITVYRVAGWGKIPPEP